MADTLKPELPKQRDELDIVLRHFGVNTPELDRLARLASDMQQIEWKLARRNSAADGGNPGQSS